jgi:tRNA A37 N6-isopentenylltransferase MiaA
MSKVIICDVCGNVASPDDLRVFKRWHWAIYDFWTTKYQICKGCYRKLEELVRSSTPEAKARAENTDTKITMETKFFGVNCRLGELEKCIHEIVDSQNERSLFRRVGRLEELLDDQESFDNEVVAVVGAIGLKERIEALERMVEKKK